MQTIQQPQAQMLAIPADLRNALASYLSEVCAHRPFGEVARFVGALSQLRPAGAPEVDVDLDAERPTMPPAPQA